MNDEIKQRLQAVLLRWESLYMAGHTKQVVEEAHEFIRKNLPNEHPLRGAFERIGFLTPVERQAKEDWDNQKKVLSILLDFVRQVVNAPLDELRFNTFSLAVVLMAEGHTDLVERFTGAVSAAKHQLPPKH